MKKPRGAGSGPPKLKPRVATDKRAAITVDAAVFSDFPKSSRRETVKWEDSGVMVNCPYCN